MAIRTIVVAALVVPFVVLTGKWTNPLQLPERAKAFLLLSAIATGASWLCYFRAIQVGELGKVALVDKSSVVLVLLMAVVFLGERPTPRDCLGLLAVLLGLAILGLGR